MLLERFNLEKPQNRVLQHNRARSEQNSLELNKIDGPQGLTHGTARLALLSREKAPGRDGGAVRPKGSQGASSIPWVTHALKEPFFRAKKLQGAALPR